jgi:hypothetical protein
LEQDTIKRISAFQEDCRIEKFPEAVRRVLRAGLTALKIK